MKFQQITWAADDWKYNVCISIQEHPCNDCGAVLDPVRLTVSTGGHGSQRTVDLRFKTVAEAVEYARTKLELP